MRFTAPAAVAVVALATPAFATFPYPAPPPGTPPQQYATYLRLPATVPPTRPSDFAGGDAWKLTSDQSGDPAIDASPRELFGVTGMSVDLAWQVTTGRPDVVIAVLDSGIEWLNAGAMADLAKKVYLNRRELPLPQDASGKTKPDAAPGALDPDPYDLDDDGVLTAADYAADPRVGDRNANGLIDPEDLILAFGDGTDADGNGYVDDIAGWDFLDDDNDPLDDVSYGHGTGEARDSTAEADNGGDLGTCPNCMVLPVRVGDSFVADGNSFGQGVVFAVDSGAHVVQEALGAVNNPQFAADAIKYAVDNDVPVIASAADEESFHHNFPAANPYTIVVNSVTRAGSLGPLVMTPPSYLYLNGCTNYGGNIAVAVSSSSCSSEATGRAAGIAGLLISAAINLGNRIPRLDAVGHVHPLKARDVRQLLIGTADDIDFSDDRNVSFGFPGLFTSTRFASQPGWDQYFGYGRLNAARAVDALADYHNPIAAELATPTWWQTFDPELTPQVTIRGVTRGPRCPFATCGTPYDFQLDVGCGVQPTEDRFTSIAAGTITGPPVTADSPIERDWNVAETAMRCAFDPSAVPITAPSGTPSPDNTPDMFTITIRLRVSADTLHAEDRRTVYIHHDPDLRKGFPLPIGGSGEPSPLFVPLRARGTRGRDDLLVATSSGAVHAFLPSGKELQGFPVFTDPLPLHTGSAGFATGAVSTAYHESIGNGLAAADLDRDGRVEIVAASLGGKVYVWDRKGRRRAGFPVTSDARFSARSVRDRFNRVQHGFIAPPVLADLDGDRRLDIVQAGMDRHVYAWRGDGTPLSGWPVLVVDRTQMASIDPVSNKVVPLSVNGQSVALQGTKIVSTPAIGPLLGDGKPVVVVGTNEEYRETPNFASERNTSIDLFVGLGVLSQANGRVYAIPAGGTDDPLGAGNAAGPFLPGWPAHLAVLAEELLPWIEGVPGSPALADVDGDGALEVGIASVAGPAYVLRADGTSFFGAGADTRPRTLPTDKATFGAGTNTTDGPSVPSLGSTIFAPIGPDGDVVLVGPGAGFGRLADAQAPAEQLPHDVHLDAWNARTGDFLPAFPRVLDDLVFFSEASVADVSGDGTPEILIGSGGYLLHAVDAAGTDAPGWPKFTGGWMIAAPAVSQRFGKGQVVAITTREGNLYVWRGHGKRKSVAPWPRYHHDTRNTGYLTR
jgi:hypothetical protein